MDQSKPRGKPFKKGTSGNPGGRPKEVRELKELARSSVPEAIRYAQRLVAKGHRALDVAEMTESELAEATRDGLSPIALIESHDPRAVLAAALYLRDTGMGKPTQAVEVSGNEGGPLQIVIKKLGSK